MAIFDNKLKQRLIGALVLIILAVVFLPMIFNNKGIRSTDTVVQVPTPPQQPEIKTPAPTPTPDITAASASTNHPTETSTPSNEAETISPPSPTPVPNVTAQQPTASTPDSNGITPTWTLQVVTLSSLPNAESFQNKLRSKNYNAYIRSEKNLHRVFVGPIISKNEAIQLQKNLEKQFGEKGIVKPFEPERQ